MFFGCFCTYSLFLSSSHGFFPCGLLVFFSVLSSFPLRFLKEGVNVKELGIRSRGHLASGPFPLLLPLLGPFPFKSLLGWVLFHHFRLILKILRKIFPNYFISISSHFPFCFLHNIYLYQNNCICLLDYLSSLLSFKFYEHENLVGYIFCSFPNALGYAKLTGDDQ